MAKGRTAGDTSKRDALARRARQAERAFRATLPKDVEVPQEEVRPTRAERRARLELQAQLGDESAKRRADAIRKRERDEAAERERLRNGRRRPHRHLPAGMREVFVVDEVKINDEGRWSVVRLANPHEPGARRVLIPKRKRTTHDDVESFERVTEKLARDAARLRGLLDVEPYQEGASPYALPRTLVRRELADAIRSAVGILDEVWVTILLELANDAAVEALKQGRGASDMIDGLPPRPIQPEAVLRSLRRQAQNTGATLPEDVDAALVAWVLSHLAIGQGKGGKNGKVNAATMRAMLADPTKRARMH
jgi:hypothetical protein